MLSDVNQTANENDVLLSAGLFPTSGQVAFKKNKISKQAWDTVHFTVPVCFGLYER